MWLFEATYDNMDNNASVKRKIEFDGDNFFDSADECYHYALGQALKMKQANELLGSLELIAC